MSTLDEARKRRPRRLPHHVRRRLPRAVRRYLSRMEKIEAVACAEQARYVRTLNRSSFFHKLYLADIREMQSEINRLKQEVSDGEGGV